ncbi:MAG: TerB family tellurite resistance protein [Myxococcota bacterium]
MSLLRFLGLGDRTGGRESEPTSLAALGSQLEELPAEDSRFIAAFAYLLARIAGADLRIEDEERATMVERLSAFAEVGPDRAGLLADAAIQLADANSASDDHLVARAFRDMSDERSRLSLLRCLYAVAAADDLITTAEDNEIFEIATEIGVNRTDVIALRAAHRAQLGTLKTLPGER